MKVDLPLLVAEQLETLKKGWMRYFVSPHLVGADPQLGEFESFH